MPKIRAATLAQHRAMRLRAVLDAARAIVTELGPDALTLTEVAKRVEISRPALYEYFSSRDDLVAAMVEDELPVWVAVVSRTTQAPDNLPEKVAAYVRAQLHMVSDGGHAIAVALAEHVLEESALRRIQDGHAQLLAPLVSALREADVTEPELRAALIQGIVNAAGRLIRLGQAADRVTEAAVAQATGGLGIG